MGGVAAPRAVGADVHFGHSLERALMIPVYAILFLLCTVQLLSVLIGLAREHKSNSRTSRRVRLVGRLQRVSLPLLWVCSVLGFTQSMDPRGAYGILASRAAWFNLASVLTALLFMVAYWFIYILIRGVALFTAGANVRDKSKDIVPRWVPLVMLPVGLLTLFSALVQGIIIAVTFQEEGRTNMDVQFHGILFYLFSMLACMIALMVLLISFGNSMRRKIEALRLAVFGQGAKRGGGGGGADEEEKQVIVAVASPKSQPQSKNAWTQEEPGRQQQQQQQQPRADQVQQGMIRLKRLQKMMTGLFCLACPLVTFLIYRAFRTQSEIDDDPQSRLLSAWQPRGDRFSATQILELIAKAGIFVGLLWFSWMKPLFWYEWVLCRSTDKVSTIAATRAATTARAAAYAAGDGSK